MLRKAARSAGAIEREPVSKVFSHIDASLREFIQKQAMFFVATAPSEGGRVNLSPKGYRDTFAVLDEHTVAYLDLFGSGAETVAHLRENGRITVMFCSFTRNSRILRLFGIGRIVRPDDAEFDRIKTHFGLNHPGIGSAIIIDVDRIADACGYAVPYYEFIDERPVLDACQAKRTDDNFAQRITGNEHSIDGLPALDPDHPLRSAIER
jgi:pyridoxamine 5'-phosphate oxidase-like protein